MKRLPSKELWRDYQEDYDPDFFQYCLKLVKFIVENLGTGEVKDPDTMALILDELTSHYESLALWLAKQRSDLNTAKTEYDVQFAQTYLEYKEAGKTDGTSKQLSKLDMADKKREIDRLYKAWLLIEQLKKSIAHYIDSMRSQISLSKHQMTYLDSK